jgi:hypothetical protein
MIDVTAYGAIGDGRNDTKSVQAAIAALGAGPGALYFPSGTYRVLSPLSFIDAMCSILGDGIAQSKIVFADSDGIILDNSSWRSRSGELSLNLTLRWRPSETATNPQQHGSRHRYVDSCQGSPSRQLGQVVESRGPRPRWWTPIGERPPRRDPTLHRGELTWPTARWLRPTSSRSAGQAATSPPTWRSSPAPHRSTSSDDQFR